jgi:sugar fermentation stimulation protein A
VNYAARFSEPLREAVLQRRYKRFLADVTMDDGSTMTVHCPNTGSMKNCIEPGMKVWLSCSANPKRKYSHTWEISETSDGDMIGVNTVLANLLVREAIEEGTITELGGYGHLQTEVRYGEENSRIDLLLSEPDDSLSPGLVGGSPGPLKADHQCYVEVKSVTLLEEGRAGFTGFFPDSVSARGSKHLRELIRIRNDGNRAVLCYCVQHSGITSVSPADHIDSLYGELLREAMDEGVEVIAYGTLITPGEVVVTGPLPVTLPVTLPVILPMN